jgi:hypothetical protein
MAATDSFLETTFDDENESDSLELNMPSSSRAVTSSAGVGVISARSNVLTHVSDEDENAAFLTVTDKQVVFSGVPSPDKDFDTGTNANDHQKQLVLHPDQSLVLTRIPNWGFGAVTPSVVPPREGGDPVRIVLDKESTTANRVSLNSSVADDSRLSHQQSPVVVERHIRSIQRQNQYNRPGLLLLSAPQQPEYDSTKQDGKDLDVNPMDAVNSGPDSSTTRSATVAGHPLPAIEVDGPGQTTHLPLRAKEPDLTLSFDDNPSEIVTSMSPAPSFGILATESQDKDTNLAKKKKFRKKPFGSLFNLLKRNLKV